MIQSRTTTWCFLYLFDLVSRRVWLDVQDYDISSDAELHVVLGGGEGGLKPYSIPDLISDGIYISAGERMQLTLRTGDAPQGKGYSANYRTGILCFLVLITRNSMFFFFTVNTQL